MTAEATGGPDSISDAELAAEGGTALPDKEVMSLLDLNANLDLALDLASPVDLAVGANANVVAPINASVDANVLSAGSTAQGEALQGAEVHQGVTGDATAVAPQVSSIDQSGSTAGAGTAVTPDTTVGTGDTSTAAGALGGPLLNVNVDLSGDLNLTAPIDGAVAANANVAAPIDASVSANVGSIDSSSTAIAHQDVLLDQNINGNATATADQTSSINQ